MSPKLFADIYEDAGEEALSRLALRGGGERGSLSCFLVHFSSRPLFPTPYRCLSVWCIRRAVVSRVGGVAFVSASATCISLLGGTYLCLCSGIIVDVSVCPRVCVKH